ncbi:retrovirus-related pol polyprotein LINE-1 [Tanacetum coccineum]
MVSLAVSKVDRLECAYLVYPIIPAIPNQSQIIWEVSIDLSHSNGYLRSCPRVGAGGYRGTRRDSRLASSRKIRVGSWNVGTLTGKFLELVDALKRKKVDIACFQETKWKGSRNKEGNQYKLWYSGSTMARNGVGVVLALNLKDKVVKVSRISDRIMMVRLVIEEETISVISAYAPQVGLGEAEKKSFWDSFNDLVRECFGYGVRNEEGHTFLEFAVTHDLVVVNSFFKKRNAHLITYHSGDHDTQIDYMLVHRGDLRVCKYCKVFPGEVCFSQHRLLALDINIKRRPCSTKMAVIPRILWKNLHGEAAEAFRTRVTEGVTPELGGRTTTDAEQMWNRLANTIREVAKETLRVVAGASRTHIGQRESWWFSEEVHNKVKAKQTRFRELISMQGNEADRSATEERYKEAKREAKKAVARAKDKAYEDLYKRLDSKEGENDIYRIAKAKKRRKLDLGSVRFMKDEDGRSIVNEDAIKRRWKEYFSALFYGQRRGQTKDVDSIDEIPIEAWRCLGGEGVRWLTIIFNKTLSRAKMPEEWRLSEERVIKRRVRRETEVAENQFGFMPGRSSMEAIHIIRTHMEKYRERQKDLHLAFLDLEKAYYSVLRQLIWKTLRDKGTPMKYIKVIQDMYEGARICVRTPTGNSEYFLVDVELHQGSAISPYLFALILDELSRGIQESIPWCLIFADDIVLVSDTPDGLNRRLEQWREMLENKGLRVSRKKTKYMRCDFNRNENDQNEEAVIRFGKHILEPKESFRYLGSVIHKSGRIEDDVTHRIQAGWLKWRAATGILCDKNVPLKLKGKFYRVAIRAAMLYGSKCWPLTKVQANMMEVAEMRMLRWTCGKTILDMIQNGAFRINLQVATIVNKMREGRLRWFGHVKRRLQSTPIRRVETIVVDGVRRRGRPKLRWEDTLKTDLKELLLSEDTTSDRNSPFFPSRSFLLIGRGVTVYIPPPPYLALAGLGTVVVVVVEFFEGWKPLSPLQLAVEEVMSE